MSRREGRCLAYEHVLDSASRSDFIENLLHVELVLLIEDHIGLHDVDLK